MTIPLGTNSQETLYGRQSCLPKSRAKIALSCIDLVNQLLSRSASPSSSLKERI